MLKKCAPIPKRLTLDMQVERMGLQEAAALKALGWTVQRATPSKVYLWRVTA